MPLCGIGFSVAGLGKIAKRLLDLRIGGGGGGGDPEPPPALEDGPANNLYVRGPVDFPLTNNAHNSFNNVLTLQEGVSFDTVSIGVNFGVGIYNNDIYVFGFSSSSLLGNGFGGNAGVYYPYTSSLPGSAVDYWGEASCGSGFWRCNKTARCGRCARHYVELGKQYDGRPGTRCHKYSDYTDPDWY